MMQLKEIELHNFGPYFGQQHLVFGSHRPIVLVHGANMRGKTTLLNAIRWALYGVAKDRFGKPMLLRNLLSWEAADQQDWTMSVKLQFRVEEQDYELTRAIQAKKPGTPPSKDSDFEQKLFLRKGHIHLNPDEAQTEINRILPEKISQFFLFDGELLNEYEVLLARSDTQSSLIKESIEHILGVPALVNAIADLKLNLKDAAKRQRNLARKDKKAKGFAKEAAQLEAEIETLENDIESLRRQHEELLKRQFELNEELQRTSGIEADAERLKQIEEHLINLTEEKAHLESKQRNNLADVWRDLLQPKVQARLEYLEEKQERGITTLKRMQELMTELGQIDALAETGRCPTCQQSLQNVDIPELERRKQKLQAELDQLEYDSDEILETGQSIKRLRKVKPAGVSADVRFIERRLTEISVTIVDLEGSQDDLNQRLKDHDHGAVVRNRREYEEVTKELGFLEKTIDQKNKLIDTKQAEAARKRDQISQVSGPGLESLNREVRLYEQLIKLFQTALEYLRDNLKESVEKDATEIFLQLTTDKSYTGLRINDYYGLTILDENGNEVPVRSAGAEQVVALALIGALNRNAVRNGPIIMDTPFGRLDPTHRENVLKFIPTMANQVTLLVHGGEVDRQRDLHHIRERIDREYKIEYVSSQRSQLKALD